MNKESKIYVVGHRGLIGNTLIRQLKDRRYSNLVYASSSEVDLTNKEATRRFFADNRPEIVYFAAAVKGGVEEYSKFPVEYFEKNIQIEVNVINACYEFNVEKLLFVGASSIFPESFDKIVREDDFKSGWVQHGTEPYSLAKAAGTCLCEYYNTEYGTRFVTALLSNIYGLSDSDHFDRTSVIPALITRFIEARKGGKDELAIWGDGSNRREFLHVEDCASALIAIMESDINAGTVNVGAGEMVSIDELASIIAKETGFSGRITHDLSKPNGSRRSVLDISRLKSIGWEKKIDLHKGIREIVKAIENGEL